MEDFKSKEILGDFLHKSPNIQETLKLTYILKCWQKLSEKNIIDEEQLDFLTFYNQKIDISKLEAVFKKLAKKHKVFSLYSFQSRYFNISEIEKLITYVKSYDLPFLSLPIYSSVFYDKKIDFLISYQIAELGVKLLGIIDNELYVPFTNAFIYSNYTNAKIYAENKFTDNELLSEIINILEDKEIEFVATDPLKYPSFTEQNAPHILKQFDNVLSFPPFGIRGKVDTSEDKFHRFKFHRGSNLDVAHFEHMLSQTKSKAVILLPVGFTFRGSYEEKFREYLIKNNLIEAVIQLPPNIHSATSIETTFFVINKNKTNNNVLFINLKDESFITRVGRSLAFKNIDEIVDIYTQNKEIENISVIVTNEEIASNNYILTIDRYVIPSEAKRLQKILTSFELINLENIADIRRSQLFKDEEIGEEIYEISPSDFATSGFTTKAKRTKKIEEQKRKFQTYKLEPFDVLLSTKGTIGKVGIIGETQNKLVASQANQVIRLNGETKKEDAISLYMFFKSNVGQSILNSLVAGTAMPQIATSEIKNMKVPNFTKSDKEKLSLNFNDEMELYNRIDYYTNEINKLHNDFLGVNK